jgi:hypothetical protein
MQTQSNVPYALVIGSKNGVKFLRVITQQQLTTIKSTHDYRLDGNRISIVSPESRALQKAWEQVKSPVGKPYHYKVPALYLDTAIVNGKWESMVVCGGLHDTFVHHDEVEAKVFYLTALNAFQEGIAPHRIAEFVPVLVEALWDMHDEMQALTLRNQVVEQVSKLPVSVGMKLMMANMFQAGLNALDPEAPCYVGSKAIQEVVQRGLFAIIDEHMEEDIDAFIEDAVYPKQK